ncbi:hypothetical protein MAUB1S_06811 [Mycolicibacterium aubagnense]
MTVDLLYADPALVDFYDLVNAGDIELRRWRATRGRCSISAVAPAN